LPDGRALGLSECGDPQGWPVFFFHGFAGSRLQRHPDDGLAQDAGVRLLAVDRPGIGRSDRLPGRRVIDWAADVAAAADAVSAAEFSVFGWSAGAPHALACAHAMPERVSAVALASPMGSWLVGPGAAAAHASRESKRMARLAYLAPRAMPLLLRGLARHARNNPARTVDSQARSLPPADQAVLADPAIHRMLVGTLNEAFRQGTAGLADDAVACARPWGFDPGAVTVPTYLWHGTADRTIPLAWARHLASRLPNCQPTWLPDEGHFMLFTHWSAILSSINKQRKT
jgi:pimeloyl-ACP methyl ester carboxylesterase